MFNPFIRCAKEPYYKQLTDEANDPVRIFEKIRKLKDQFKPDKTVEQILNL